MPAGPVTPHIRGHPFQNTKECTKQPGQVRLPKEITMLRFDLIVIRIALLALTLYAGIKPVIAQENVAMLAPTLKASKALNKNNNTRNKTHHDVDSHEHEQNHLPSVSILEAVNTGLVETLARDESFWTQKRELHVYRHGLKETLKIVYWENGQYIRSALKKLNRLCMDIHNGRITRMDKEVFDSLWAAQQIAINAGYHEPMEITSAYRSPQTNQALINDGVKAAKNSLHLKGRAIDFRIPGLSNRQLGKLMRAFNFGGVGTYHREKGGWVHVDTGRPRAWKG